MVRTGKDRLGGYNKGVEIKYGAMQDRNQSKYMSILFDNCFQKYTSYSFGLQKVIPMALPLLPQSLQIKSSSGSPNGFLSAFC